MESKNSIPFNPLAGIRVLDFSKVLAGPLCTQYLADMGADVIKIEPLGGDDTRKWPPFEGRDGTVFVAVNRNKRSLAVDLKAPDGLAICRRLAAAADVVIESYGPGVAARLGIGDAQLRELNPRMIYCSISGYGTRGPMKDHKGFDLIAQSFTGMLSITGEPDGPPVRSPFSPIDQGTGMNAVIGILCALMQRAQTGQGTKLEASLFDTAVGFLGYFLQSFWQRGIEPLRAGSGHESLCPYQAFETKDKPLILGVANDSLWISFCDVAGVTALAIDPRFATAASRVQNRSETVATVAQILHDRTRDEWLSVLEARGIPCAPVHTLGELNQHPHTVASDMILAYRDRDGRDKKAVATPLRINGKRPTLRAAPPDLGEHSLAILRELGYPDETVAAWLKQGIIADGNSRGE
ncbi:MAG: CoA transferase [Gammaproteobacteria bacterium]|nr:CoA transferase [Gammaproteobacteria bacterium]